MFVVSSASALPRTIATPSPFNPPQLLHNHFLPQTCRTFFTAGASCKMALVLRADVGMTKGKLCAQASHAAVQSVLNIVSSSSSSSSSSGRNNSKEKAALETWLERGQTKVVLKASSAEELIGLVERAKAQRVPFALVRDAGHTQVEPGTITALALGPALENEINNLTGHLKLL